MKMAFFILSTGRCGTQWIFDFLRQVCDDNFLITHEPLAGRYQPRKILRFKDPNQMEPGLPEATREHVRHIADCLETRHYIECGHPCWSTLPYFIEKFKDRVGIVHLVRHPVHTAFSWLTHRAYCPPLLPYLREKAWLSPFDEGVNFPEYKPVWDRLHPYEKSLYFWAEITAFGLNLEHGPDIPWLRLKSEAVFNGDGLEKLCRFLGIGTAFDPVFRESRVDKFHCGTEYWCDWRLIRRHPVVVDLARGLGYGLDDIDDARLYKRYALVQ
ncbi:MAG TPA: hypothetical protein DHV36_04770 [Desulfobacteraceae bacterium]|nr:hypothetical protein [Desulfobacteraceae bacterium]